MKLRLLICALAMASLGATTQAAEVTFAGTTSGTFTATPPSLTFTGTTFMGTTANGAVAFSNLGSFNLQATDMTYNGMFSLNVTFTAPPGTGPNPGTFNATLTGTVTSTGNGGVFIDFANNRSNPQSFTFSNGSFKFFVDDNSVQPGQPSTLSGGVLGATVPDGGTTVALLGMGLVGVAALRRKLGRA